ncbi:MULTISPECIES: hypothetical protein [unclassified Streptomyces]|uniref:hypothetical protein n=1 Tax=unclassified Streptomyces TaxID=2593676 RepID=UPI00136E2669|nr:hypothetical protein [Streptomyces sp. SID4982]MYS14911.1 hypothetical protein [Streptomyces sp. SID4982]
MTNSVSTLISALGALVSVLLLALAVGEYRSGASALWPVAASVIFLSSSYALVRDLRRARAGTTT